jgi:hypothetical protein
MAEVDTYGFDLKEVTTALIKQQGIHEGLWMMSFEFNLGAGMAGSTKEEVRPVAFVQINKISLVRQKEIPSGHNLAINAAEVNPAPVGQQSKTAKEVRNALKESDKPLSKDRRTKPPR